MLNKIGEIENDHFGIFGQKTKFLFYQQEPAAILQKLVC
jgi:hypothetical protein